MSVCPTSEAPRRASSSGRDAAQRLAQHEVARLAVLGAQALVAPEREHQRRNHEEREEHDA